MAESKVINGKTDINLIHKLISAILIDKPNLDNLFDWQAISGLSRNIELSFLFVLSSIKELSSEIGLHPDQFMRLVQDRLRLPDNCIDIESLHNGTDKVIAFTNIEIVARYLTYEAGRIAKNKVGKSSYYNPLGLVDIFLEIEPDPKKNAKYTGIRLTKDVQDFFIEHQAEIEQIQALIFKPVPVEQVTA